MGLKSNRSRGDKIFDIANYSLIIILSVLFIYPFWDTVVLSFTSPRLANTLGFRFYPKEFSLGAYSTILQDSLILTAFKNTILRTVLGTAITLFVTFFAAYALTNRKLPLRNLFTFVMLITLFFSGGLIPTYLNIRTLGMIDTIWVLVLPSAFNAWYIFLARNFLMALPQELEESAEMDGANPIQKAIRIIFPLSMPIIAVIALWSAVYHWNAWYDALVYIRDRSHYVLQLLVYKLMIQQQDVGNTQIFRIPPKTTIETIKAATIVFSIAPILVLYPFLQRYFVKGIMVGSLKG